MYGNKRGYMQFKTNTKTTVQTAAAARELAVSSLGPRDSLLDWNVDASSASFDVGRYSLPFSCFPSTVNTHTHRAMRYKHTGLRNEGNVLFNVALNTFYLRLYGVGRMVKDHSDSERKSASATWATLSD